MLTWQTSATITGRDRWLRWAIVLKAAPLNASARQLDVSDPDLIPPFSQTSLCLAKCRSADAAGGSPVVPCERSPRGAPDYQFTDTAD